MMKLRLKIPYFAASGEKLAVAVGGRVHEMTETEPGVWAADRIRVRRREGTFRFEVRKDGVPVRREWREHALPGTAAGEADEVRMECRWNDIDDRQPFYSSLFTDSLFRREAEPDGADRPVILQVSCAEIPPKYHLALAGSIFKDWGKFRKLNGSAFPLWRFRLKGDRDFEYKYVLLDRETGRTIWEQGENRRFKAASSGQSGLRLIEDRPPLFEIEAWKGTGTAIPVFSLRSEDSFGVGEFMDLKKMVDWAARTGQQLIQVLPVNDTTMTRTWQDSYPYRANSSFALHPQFISLPAAGQYRSKAYLRLQRELNALDGVDYERVNAEKEKYLRKLYARSAKVLESESYRRFASDSRGWLLPYAVFSCLRDETGTPDFRRWGKFAKYTAPKAERYAAAHPKEVGYYFYVQYLLDKQLKEVVEYAHSKGVALKGDLPIGIGRTSADAWQHPGLFNRQGSAGAPPDAFSTDGQNWGFPTYNWEKMAGDGYAWWRARLAKMGAYFDAFRIDHILGFFRIWEIPTCFKGGLLGHFRPALPYPRRELEDLGFSPGKTPADGNTLFVEDPYRRDCYHPRIAAQQTGAYSGLDPERKAAFDRLYEDFFYHRHNEFWKAEALKKLPALLRPVRMLTCGEDLGMIPSCVPEVMRTLRILSLEIERMPKAAGSEFADTGKYPYLCVCTTGTHDTSTLRAWWEENRESTQRYYHDVLHRQGTAPETLTPELAEEIISRHLASDAMFVVPPLQDWLATDGGLRYPGDVRAERINVPADPHHYWRYRMHLTLEELLRADRFNDRLRRLTALRQIDTF